MGNRISILTYFLSVVAAISTAIATIHWFWIVTNESGWGAMGFLFFFTPCLGGGSLLLGVIPSGILYSKKRERRDLVSLWLSSCSCVIVAAESALLFVVRLHGS